MDIVIIRLSFSGEKLLIIRIRLKEDYDNKDKINIKIYI